MRNLIGAWVGYRYKDEDEYDDIRDGYISFSKTEAFGIDECDEFGVPDSEISFYMDKESFVNNVCHLIHANGLHDYYFYNPNIDDFEIKLVDMKYRYAIS
jgi:hypothetical protein